MIEVRGLTKRFGSTLAVDDLSFSVRPGRVTGFLGPNGAGKTTTMRAILGLDRADAGSTLIGGRPYGELPAPLREVGALLDAKALHGGRRAYNHLLCLAESNGIARKRVDEVLGIVGLSEVAQRRAGGFSLGMGQRLGIAGALLGDPGVLMFDEPVNGLDPEGIRWIRGLMRSLAAEGRTVFVSSHLISEMALTADHLVVIGKGRLIADASVDELVRGGGSSVLVRSPDAALLQPKLAERGATVERGDDGALIVRGMEAIDVGRVARECGALLAELTPRQSSLEEAFMELTESSTEYHSRAGAPPGDGAASAGGAQR